VGLPKAIKDGKGADVVSLVKALPRHKSAEFIFFKVGFLGKLERLMADLDDVGEFVGLETAGRYFTLTIKHR
jgi:hypothetical protein